MNFKTLSAFACLTAFIATGYGQSIDAPAEDWEPLFNGEDLEGWEFKIRGQEVGIDPRNTFYVEDGSIVVDYSQYPNFNGEPFGHLWYTEREFSHYILHVEYQFWDTQVSGGPSWAVENNGIMFHAQPIETMGLNQDFPISIEAQLLHGTTMNLCTPGTHFHNMSGALVTDHCTNASPKQVDNLDWVSVDLMVFGDSIVHHVVEGDTVLSYKEPVTGGGNVSGNTQQVVNNGKLDRGYFTFQGESAPTRFRTVEILNLEGCMDPSSPSYREYFTLSDPEACETVGINPAGPKSDFLEKGLYSSVRVNLSEPYQLEVFDVGGHRLESFHESLPVTFDFSGLPAGLLFVRLSYGGSSSQIRLLNP